MKRFRAAKIHAIGQMQGSGFYRTLCDYYQASGPTSARVGDSLDEVDCVACLKKLNPYPRIHVKILEESIFDQDKEGTDAH